MKRQTRLSILVAMLLLATVIAYAQGGSNTTEHYVKDGLAFDYPSGWRVSDNSTQDVQTVIVAPEGGSTRIVVRVKSGPVTSCDFQGESTKIAHALTEKVAAEINAGSAPRTSLVKTQIGSLEAEGTEVRGVIDHKPAIGEIYSIRLGQRLVSLVYVRVDNEERASSAWNTIRTTFKVEPAVIGVTTAASPDSAEATITSGVLNGRALHLPAPGYPAIARQAHASGTITVQVVIDELGTVISAHAIAGHPLLRAVSVAAAREASFSPTKLCNEPVRVAGVITYNFVGQ